MKLLLPVFGSPKAYKLKTERSLSFEEVLGYGAEDFEVFVVGKIFSYFNKFEVEGIVRSENSFADLLTTEDAESFDGLVYVEEFSRQVQEF